MNILKSQDHPIRQFLTSQQQIIDDHFKKSAIGSLEPVQKSRHGDFYDAKKTTSYVIQTVMHEPNELLRRAKNMTNTTQDAIDLIQRVEAQAAEAVTKLTKTSQSLEDMGKEVSGKVRMHAERMAAGLRKIQSTANFAELERQTEVMERMAAAMSTLAELESRGVLAKISAAMK